MTVNDVGNPQPRPFALADLTECFDSVVMLTWSDWKTEPRSNRYHYATRFSEKLPVYFVQPDSPPLGGPLERTEFANITIVHSGQKYGRLQSLMLEAILAELDVKRPLIWVYNVFFHDFIVRHTNQMIVYHATEDYLCDPSEMFILNDMDPIIEGFDRILPHVDLVIAVAESIRTNFHERGGYRGPSILVQNGCDANFWIARSAHRYIPPLDGPPVAFYQGAINERLDFALLTRVVRALPDWEFWFCGKNVDPPGWSDLAAQRNVKYLGMLPLEKVAAAARHASVGISPFVNRPLMRISVNLKYYEYVACGLPVVSSPNDALLDRPELFAVAEGPDEFVKALRALAPTRTDPVEIERRLAAANEQTYDRKFATVCNAILHRHQELSRSPERRHVLVLYDDKVGTDQAELARLLAFKETLTQDVYYLPCIKERISLLGHSPPPVWDLTWFDAIVLDTSLAAEGKNRLTRERIRTIRAYDGLKIMLAYDKKWRWRTIVRAKKIRVDAIVTNLPKTGLRSWRVRAGRRPRVVHRPLASADTASTVDAIIRELSTFKRSRAELVTVPVSASTDENRQTRDSAWIFTRPDEPNVIVRPRNPELAKPGGLSARHELTIAAIRPRFGGLFGLQLLCICIMQWFVRKFFSGWDRVPATIRVPIVGLLPRRMRQAARASVAEGGVSSDY